MILMVGGFIAGFFDSVVGGGGVITLPSLLWAGLPPYFALGTNKLAGTFASSTSSVMYFRSQWLDKKLLSWMFPFTFVGAALGVLSVLQVNERYLQVIILVAIVVITIVTLFKKNMGHHNRFRGVSASTLWIALPVAFALGFYDGFVGPGTGSFLLFVFLTIFQFDFRLAAGNGRVLNLSSNLAALLLFALRGKVVYLIGLPMGVAMMLGARTGSKLAISKGVSYIRPLFILVAIILSIKMAYTVFL